MNPEHEFPHDQRSPVREEDGRREEDEEKPLVNFPSCNRAPVT